MGISQQGEQPLTRKQLRELADAATPTPAGGAPAPIAEPSARRAAREQERLRAEQAQSAFAQPATPVAFAAEVLSPPEPVPAEPPAPRRSELRRRRDVLESDAAPEPSDQLSATRAPELSAAELFARAQLASLTRSEPVSPVSEPIRPVSEPVAQPAPAEAAPEVIVPEVALPEGVAPEAAPAPVVVETPGETIAPEPGPRSRGELARRSPAGTVALADTDTAGTKHLAPTALIFNNAPDPLTLSAPITSTGELLVTGVFELPRGVGSRGAAPGTTDDKEIDAALVDLELAANSSPAPVSASAAISTLKNTGEVMRQPRPEKGRGLLVGLTVTAGCLVVAVTVALVLAFTNGVF